MLHHQNHFLLKKEAKLTRSWWYNYSKVFMWY